MATLTWCSGKTLKRLARIFGSPSHGHPVDVPWRSCLARLHHRPYWSLRDYCRVAGLLGAGRLPQWIDVDGACVWLRWLDRMVRLPGAGWQWWDNERDVESGPGGIWQRIRTLWSRNYSLKKKRHGVSAVNVPGNGSKTKRYWPYWKRPVDTNHYSNSSSIVSIVLDFVNATLKVQVREPVIFRGIKVNKTVPEHGPSVTPCQESDQSLSCYEISSFFTQVATQNENPCIIKNKLNLAIMSYCDNPKSLFHFLPGPPSTHELSWVYISHELWNRGWGAVTTKSPWKGPRKFWCFRKHHPDQMFFPRQQTLQTSLCMCVPKVLDYITRRKMVSGGPPRSNGAGVTISFTL